MRRAIYNLRYVELSGDGEGQHLLATDGDPQLTAVIPEPWAAKSLAQGDKTFEVSQLLGSFMLAMVHPWEKHYEKQLAVWTIEEANAIWNIPVLVRTKQNRPVDNNSLQDFVNFFRNSLAHGNMNISVQDGNIWRLTLWNIPYDRKTNQPTADKKKWTFMNVEISDLRQFLLGFVAMTEEFIRDGGEHARQRLENTQQESVA
jgi:hypothetical protein